MTNEEKQAIIDAVLAAIKTNSMKIEDLTDCQGDVPEGSYLELSGGYRISYDSLKAALEDVVSEETITPAISAIATQLRSEIADEASARQDADSEEVANRTAAINALSTTLTNAINDEAAARQAADNTEAAARKAADDAETLARVNADTQEASTRQAAITAEAAARQAADSAEEAARIAADEDIQELIDALEAAVALKFDKSSVVEADGSASDKVMSQKYVSQLINSINLKLASISVHRNMVGAEYITLTFVNASGTESTITLPKATQQFAGLMSAADKRALDTAESNISNLQEGLSVAEGNITSLQTDVNNLLDDMELAQSNIQTLQADMTQAKSDIEDAESDIGTLQADMTQAKSDIEDLQAKEIEDVTIERAQNSAKLILETGNISAHHEVTLPAAGTPTDGGTVPMAGVMTAQQAQDLEDVLLEAFPLIATFDSDNAGNYEKGESVTPEAVLSVKRRGADVDASELTISTRMEVDGKNLSAEAVTTDASFNVSVGHKGSTVVLQALQYKFLNYVYGFVPTTSIRVDQIPSYIYNRQTHRDSAPVIDEPMEYEELSDRTTFEGSLAAGESFYFLVPGNVTLVCRDAGTNAFVKDTNITVRVPRQCDASTLDTYTCIIVPASDIAWNFIITNS